MIFRNPQDLTFKRHTMRQPSASRRPEATSPAHGDETRPTRRRVSGPTRPAPGPPLAELDFESAYRRMPMCAEERARYEGRLALWDRATQTALEVRDNSPRHEYPAQLLAALAERIALVRGKPIRCFGTMSLFLLGDDGGVERTMQADQTLYLHPERANPVGWSRMVVGENHYPDVVLEVDNTTDVRRHKLKLYEAWGFPELWVEVPDASPRPAKWHGLSIHVLEDSAFQEVAESRAFPGWTAADIHAALNEGRLSQRTHAILERVGAALAKREGAQPNEDPLLRSQRQQGRQQGRREGRREGRQQGVEAGRRRGRQEALAEARAGELERRAAMVRAMLASRGLDVSADFPRNVPDFAAAGAEEVAAAATLCADEVDFAARLRSVHAPTGG